MNLSMNIGKNKSFSALFFILFLILSSDLSSQTSSSFNIEKNVVAGGGQQSSSPNFTFTATIGQPTAGNRSISQSFISMDGFWTFNQLVPTSANVELSGRVSRKDGQGISLALVTLTDLESTLHKQTRTNGFGIYRFSDVGVGRFYLVTVSHSRFHFDVSSIGIQTMDNIFDLNFQGYMW